MIRFTESCGSAIINGEQVVGELTIYYTQLSQGLAISPEATAFLSQGKMPTFIFGLPAAAFAMYKSALSENRNKIKSLLISGVIATAITGITEPIEFLFIFISPLLWIFHVVMTGLGFMVMTLLGVTIGNTDGELLDFFIFGVMQGSYTKWWLVLIVGAVWFTVYYFVFKTVILKRDLATPGRKTIMESNIDYTNEELKTKGNISSRQAEEILEALGGKENIDSLDNCVTRLRLILRDGQLVNDEKLKDLGALGVVHLDNRNVQVIIGTRVTNVRNKLDTLLHKD